MILAELLSKPNIKKSVSLSCVYPKSYILASEGDVCTKIGIIVSGSLTLIHTTKEGNELVLGQLKTEDVFGDFLIHSSTPYYPGHLLTQEETTVTYIDKDQLERLIVNDQQFRQFYLTNLSAKGLRINTHNRLLAMPTIKDKVLFYLEMESKKTNNHKVQLKSKASLARYLGVERPSLARVLKQLREAHVIDYNKREIWPII